jgi:hypothetical protein
MGLTNVSACAYGGDRLRGGDFSRGPDTRRGRKRAGHAELKGRSTMLRRTILPVAILAALVAGCGPEAARTAPQGEVRATSAGTLAANRFQEAVVLLGTSHWSEYVYHGIGRDSFRVELSVRNDSSSKSVGIVWSKDDWASSQEAPAAYETTLPDGRERWAVEVRDFNTGYFVPEVRFAAFVKANGQTSWSPLRNHTVYATVSPEQPVRVLATTGRLDSGGTPFVEGRVRALNLPGASVFVRYSIDAWKTVRDFSAVRAGDDWAFSIPLHPDAASDAIETAEFAVAYEAEGQRFWDNHGGANYSMRLAPKLENGGFQDDGAVASSGIRVFKASVGTALPLESAALRIDGAPAIALPLLKTMDFQNKTPGFTKGGDILYLLPVEGLSPGEHTLSLEVVAGPFTRSFAPVMFRVSRGIKALSSWDLKATAGGSVWDFRELADGRVLVLRSSGLERYARFGDATPELVFAAGPSASSKLHLAVDSLGRAYALDMHSQITRWQPDGKVDAAFGSGGLFKLDDNYFGVPLQHASAIEVTPDGLFVTDSLNLRLLRFSHDAAFIEAVNLTLGQANVGRVGHMAFDGESLWVERAFDGLGTSKRSLIRIGEYRGQRIVAEVIEVDPSTGTLEGFSVTPSAILMTGNSSNLHVLARTGRRLSTWTGGGSYEPMGSLDLALAVRPLADGSIAVVSANTNRLEQFQVELP